MIFSGMPAAPFSRRIVLLTEGHSEPLAGKTASCLLRYRTADIVAILDSTQAGRTADELFRVGGAIPVVATLDELNEAALVEMLTRTISGRDNASSINARTSGCIRGSPPDRFRMSI